MKNKVMRVTWFLIVCYGNLLAPHLVLRGNRTLLGVLLVVSVVSWLTVWWHQRKRLAVSLFMFGWLTILSPVDISMENYPGLPHFVQLVKGLPTADIVRRADRHEVLLGGCLTFGIEPKYVLVW